MKLNTMATKFFTRTHIALYRMTGGQLGGRFRGSPVLLLTTTAAAAASFASPPSCTSSTATARSWWLRTWAPSTTRLGTTTSSPIRR